MQLVTNKGKFISRDYDSSSEQLYLHFLLDGHSYGLLATNIKHLVNQVHVTEIPDAPKYICGNISFHNTVVPVVDLKQRFSGKSTVIGNRTSVVILEIKTDKGKPEDVGLLVDEIKEMNLVQLNDIEPPQPIKGQVKSDFIIGMTEIGGELTTLLEI